MLGSASVPGSQISAVPPSTTGSGMRDRVVVGGVVRGGRRLRSPGEAPRAGEGESMDVVDLGGGRHGLATGRAGTGPNIELSTTSVGRSPSRWAPHDGPHVK